MIDIPHLAAGTVPADDFDRRYVTHPWLAYLHIRPGVLYLLLAILQLTYRFRSRHYPTHRRLGRIAAGAAMISGVFALIFGGLFSFGGPSEASASVVFSAWLLVTVALAVHATRRGDIVRHRRWMIRAFAVGAGVGTSGSGSSSFKALASWTSSRLWGRPSESGSACMHSPQSYNFEPFRTLPK
ncbi:MAG TPA: DUF2306 domain-containing protein [Propionibacteriaceae bacterium]